MKRCRRFKFFKLLLSVTTVFAFATVFASGDASIHPQRGVAANNGIKPIPKQDITRFIKSIAIVKHYYIKKTPTNELFDNAIAGMVAQLDPHSNFLDAQALKELNKTVSGKFVGIGIELTTDKGALKVISPLDGTPAFRAGIKSNDLIIKVNDKLVQNMTLLEAINHIKGPKGTIVRLTVIRRGVDKPLVFNIKRDVVKIIAVKSKLLEPSYAYVKLSFFQGPVSKELNRAIAKMKAQADPKIKGLILDLRNNPGGLLRESARVADTFLDAARLKRYHDLIVYTKGRIPGADIQLKAHPGDKINGAPLVVLINSGSASASEIVAGALQDYQRAIIMGTRSFGKGSVQTVIPVTKHSAIKLTTSLYYTPSGRAIQAQGIVPNVTVPGFTVATKDKAGLKIDESDFIGHIAGSKQDKKALNTLKNQQKKELKLARKDYQLYQALMMLKGINALKVQTASAPVEQKGR